MRQSNPTNTDAYSDMHFTRTSVVKRFVGVIDDAANHATENTGMDLVEVGDLIRVRNCGVHRSVRAHRLSNALTAAVRVLTVDSHEVLVKVADGLRPHGFPEIDGYRVSLLEVVLDHGPEHWSIGLSYGGVAS